MGNSFVKPPVAHFVSLGSVVLTLGLFSSLKSQDLDTSKIERPLYFLSDTIFVTAFRERSQKQWQHQALTKIEQREIWSEVSPAIDDLLRTSPGFSLFRRSSSRVANPTSQGVSLRGVGPSGASRTLVLRDDIPLNDPFGGWVYWNRINRAALGRIEVVRGGSSSLYGGEALSGVIQTHSDRQPHRRVLAQGSSLGTYDVSISWGDLYKISPDTYLNAILNAKGGLVGNYYVVEPSARGSVDERAYARFKQIETSLRWLFPSIISTLGVERFLEDRNNGTALQTNSTRTTLGWTSLFWQITESTSLETILRHQVQMYDQTFTTVASGRNTEAVSRIQEVPSSSWSMHIIGRSEIASHLVQLGVEVKRNRGSSDELQYVSDRPFSELKTGGDQYFVGFYGQDRFSLFKDLTIALSGRVDWVNQNQRDSSLRVFSSGAVFSGERVSSSSTFLSQRISVAWFPAEGQALRGSFYRSHRIPTLNELYRGFRVGNTQTLPNSRLSSEFILGAEIGYDFHELLQKTLSLTATVFVLDLKNAISNVTLPSVGTLITRRRENVGLVRSQGAEIEAEWKPWKQFIFKGNYLFSDSKVMEAADAVLEGNRVAQIPMHQAYLEAQWIHQSLEARIAVKSSSSQFEDDQNSLNLKGFATIDLIAGYRLIPRLKISLAIENLTDRVIQVSRTPAVGIGPPRTFVLSMHADF